MPPQVDTAWGDLFTGATSGVLGACPSLRIRDPWLSNWRKRATGCHRLLSKLTKAYYAVSLRTILEEPPGLRDPALAVTSKKCYEATNGNVVPVQSRAKKKVQLRNRQAKDDFDADIRYHNAVLGSGLMLNLLDLRRGILQLRYRWAAPAECKSKFRCQLLSARLHRKWQRSEQSNTAFQPRSMPWRIHNVGHRRFWWTKHWRSCCRDMLFAVSIAYLELMNYADQSAGALATTQQSVLRILGTQRSCIKAVQAPIHWRVAQLWWNNVWARLT